MPRAIVDGANVAHDERTARQGKPRVSNIVALRQELEDRGYAVTVIVDASLIHDVDDPEQLEGLLQKGDVRQVPAGTDADYFILEAARQQDAIVVSNDRFQKWRDRFPWVDERRVPVMIVDGRPELYEPRLDEIAG